MNCQNHSTWKQQLRGTIQINTEKETFQKRSNNNWANDFLSQSTDNKLEASRAHPTEIRKWEQEFLLNNPLVEEFKEFKFSSEISEMNLSIAAKEFCESVDYHDLKLRNSNFFKYMQSL